MRVGASDLKMNIYYTAKDIEELAAKGLREIEIGPHVFLTDFAYETAEQLNIALVKPGMPISHTQSSAPTPPKIVPQGRYNKPQGCQHGGSASSRMQSVNLAQAPVNKSAEGAASVNKLVDIMGKIMKRGD